MGGEPFAPEGHPQAREREEEDLRREIVHLEQVEKKEDTVDRETMINGAMSSTLMG
jgi:hypothetical protein